MGWYMYWYLAHLWCNKVCCVARRHEQAVLCTQLLGKAKVSDAQTLWVADGAGVEEVGWFEVTVDNALLVQEVHCGCLQVEGGQVMIM